MSWKATAYIKDVYVAPNGEKLLPLEKLVSFNIADSYNNDRGFAWTSEPLLAQQSLCSVRHLRRVLANIERKGLLSIRRHRVRGWANEYSFPEMPRGTPCPPNEGSKGDMEALQGGQQRAPRRTQDAPKADRAMSSQPSVSPSIDKPPCEPSGMTPASEAASPTDSDTHKSKGASKNGNGLLVLLDIDLGRIRKADAFAMAYLCKCFDMEPPQVGPEALAQWLDTKLKWLAGEGMRYPKVILARLKQLQRGQFTLPV